MITSSTGVIVHGPVLSFSNVELAHNGTYRCEVVNSFGTTSNEVHLIVIITPTLTIEPKQKLQLRLGTSIELVCRISPIFYQNVDIT